VVDVAGVGALVEQADQQEQCAGDEAVGDHLHDSTGQADGVERGDPQQHHPHVADRGVGDHCLEVALPPGEQAAVEQAENGERGERALQRQDRLGQHGRGAYQAVGAHLQ
jgi:hypothetical protein